MDKTPKQNYSKPIAIGIDLGTTYSCVAAYKENGTVEVIANAEGSRITPSIVAFTKSEHFIGESAKLQAIENPTNTLFGIKRIIGRKFQDESLRSDIKRWPFNVVCDGDRPIIEVMSKNEKKLFAPEEISAMVLTKMKESAEALLECKVTDAVITVPASFNDSQRKATIDAGKIAGLNVLRIMSEPTAGALAYAVDKKEKVAFGRNVLVFDLGGGTFDVSILTVKDGNFEVKAVAGDTHLGGEDFDNRLLDAMVKDFKRKFRKDITINAKAMARLKRACEQAKRDLSSSLLARLSVDSLFDGIDFSTSITRSRFEDLNADFFEKTIKIVKEALQNAKLGPNDIHDVVLVGGSTRIPKIQALLGDLFGASKLTKGINPDEAVAYGAAIQAAKLQGDISDGIRNLQLHDVTPLSLGIETEGGHATVLIKRNTTIPTKITQKFPTSEDDQDAVSINIYEGEHPMFIDNNHLGNFVLHGIPPAPIGVVEVEVTFDIDHNGTLTVSAVETIKGVKNQISITSDQGRLSNDEVVHMRHDAEKCRDENKRQQHISLIESNLMEVIGSIETKLGNNSNHIAVADKRKIQNCCNNISEWLEEDKPKSLQEYDDKKKELEEVCNPIFQKLGL